MKEKEKIPFLNELETYNPPPALLAVWFGWDSLFNGISTFVGYLMPKPSL